MITKIKKALTPPTAQELARRRLDEHERQLVDARRVSQAAQATVGYHERVIADLRRSLAEESAR